MSILKRLVVVAAIASGSISAPASAQEWKADDGKLLMRFNESREAGRLVGCDLFLVQAGFDDVYMQGKPVIINTLIALVLGKPKDDFSIILKVSGYDPNSARANAGVIFTPTYAYISSLHYSSAKQEIAILPNCDGPGFCSIFKTAASVNGILKTITYAGMTINVQRRSGGLDLKIPIMFDGPVAPYSNSLSTCARSLIGGVVR